MHGKKKGEGWSGVEIFPTLVSAKVKVADKDTCQRSIRRQAKKQALSPHRGQARPLISGVGKTALLPLFLSRKTGKARHTCEGNLQGTTHGKACKV